MKKAKNSRFWIALVIFSLVGQVAWVVENMYLNVFIYKMFNASAQAISSMVSASAIAATVTTLLVGALSERPADVARNSRFGLAGLLHEVVKESAEFMRARRVSQSRQWCQPYGTSSVVIPPLYHIRRGASNELVMRN